MSAVHSPRPQAPPYIRRAILDCGQINRQHMYRWYRKVRRWNLEASTRQKIAAFGITVITLWVLGLIDRLTEKSFDEFSWPSEPLQSREFSRFTEFPECRFTENDELKLMIIVKSAAKNKQWRDSIRKTWGKYRLAKKVQVMSVFVIGKVEDSEVNRRAEKESAQLKDILALSTTDSYRNNTLKFFAALDYSSNPSKCVTPDAVFLVDDDYVVNIPNLIELAKKRPKNELVYEGFVFDTSPFRLKLHKHYISVQDYPFSRYPPYVSAGAVFLTQETVKQFQKAMRNLKMFPFDDVFTGILAKALQIPATHNQNFVFWSRHVTGDEWKNGVIAVHGFAGKDLENEYKSMTDGLNIK